jgi:hypothetical protein
MNQDKEYVNAEFELSVNAEFELPAEQITKLKREAQRRGVVIDDVIGDLLLQLPEGPEGVDAESEDYDPKLKGQILSELIDKHLP